jgi:hypothetical protein
MRTVEPGDVGDDDQTLARALQKSEEPIMLRRAGASWQTGTLAALLEKHGSDIIKVVTSGGVYRGEAKVEVSMPLRDFAPAARNGTVPESSYIFADVSGLPLAGAAREVRQLFARVSVLRDAGYAAIPAAAGGRPILSVGGWGHGRPFHSHGPALNGLTAGVKHWFIRRPNASEAMAVPPGLQAGQPMPERWEAQMWMCTQNIGDVLWIPDRLEHATANYADLAVSLFTVIDDLSETPLIAAAKAGDELAVKTLLAGAPHNADTAARSRSGGTALTYAAGVGCAGVVRQLLVAGADVGAATSSGATALHAATFGGHVAAVEALLEGGARIDARDGRGQTALELALQREDAREVRKLLEQAAAAKGGEDASNMASKLDASKLLAPGAGASAADAGARASSGHPEEGGGDQACEEAA